MARGAQGVGQGSVGEVPEAEAYEFAIRDEHGIAGENPTVANALSCSGAGTTAIALETDPWKVLSQAKSRRLNDLLAPEDSGSLGVYFDEAGTQCSGTIHPALAIRNGTRTR